MLKRLFGALALALVISACTTPAVDLEVTALNPDVDAVDVSVDTVVSATFSVGIDPTTVDGNFALVAIGGEAVAGTVTYDAATRTAVFTPTAALAYATEYTATLSGSVATTGGTTLGGEATWSFTTEDEPAPDPAIGGLTVDPAAAALAIGETVALSAVPSDVVGTPDLTVVWTSDAEGVATVDASGLVTAIAAGTATITATSNFDASLTATASITVEPDPAIGGLTVSPDEAGLAIADTVQLNPVFSGVVGTPTPVQTVTWSSDDTGVATVDVDGLVTAVAAGTATITATSDFDASITGTAVIVVVAPMTVEAIEAYVATVDAGEPVGQLSPVISGGALPFTFAELATDPDGTPPFIGLPDGVVLDEATGVISGTPLFANFYRAAIEVTDAVGQTLTIWAEIDVNLVLEYAQTAYAYTDGVASTVVPASDVTLIGGTGPAYFYSMTLLSSSPDAGAADAFTIDADTGAISRAALSTPTTTNWVYRVSVFDDGSAEFATFDVTFVAAP